MQNIIDEKINFMNKMARALAKEEGITEVQALSRIKKEFTDRDETAETIRGLSMPPRIVDYGNTQKVAPEDAYAVVTEQSKVEMKKIDLQQKQLDNEQKRMDAEAKKQEYLERKLEMEERRHQEELKYQREKDEAERKYQRQKDDADTKIREQQAGTERLILLSTLSSGKKGAPDEMMEYLKSQSESTKEFYKAQGESTKGMYETLLNAKNSERDREFEWKKELAKIEADREVELEKLRSTTDSETSTSTETIVSMLAEKLDRFADQNQKVNNADDFVAKMNEYNKMQDTVIKSSLGILKARGFSEEQLEVVKSAVTSEEDRQKGTLDKIWQVGKEVWRQIEPKILPTQTPEQAQQAQLLAIEQQRVARDRDEKLRQQVEVEACRLATENAALEQEKTKLQQIESQNRSLQQTYLEQRTQLAQKAVDLGLILNDQMNNEQIFTAIEQREAEIERHQQKEYENQQVREREAEARTVEVAQEQALELESTPETIPEKPGIPHTETEPEQKSEEAEEQAPVREPGKQKRKGPKGGKDKHTFTIYNSDGTLLSRVESVTHKSAGLKIANTLNGTPENPIRIKISSESGEEKQFDAYSAMVENNAGTKYPVPRVRSVI